MRRKKTDPGNLRIFKVCRQSFRAVRARHGIIHLMKRLILILLLTILPIQMTWAAAASVVCHLTKADAVEFSQSHADQSSAERAHTKDSKEKRVAGDCCPHCHAFCHLSAVAPTHTLEPVISLQQDTASILSANAPYQSYIPDGPIRPKWLAAS